MSFMATWRVQQQHAPVQARADNPRLRMPSYNTAARKSQRALVTSTLLKKATSDVQRGEGLSDHISHELIQLLLQQPHIPHHLLLKADGSDHLAAAHHAGKEQQAATRAHASA